MTQPVTQVEGPAFAMLQGDIDTDAIYPAQYLKTTERKGLRACLFADWVAAGNPHAALVTSPRATRILVTGQNFGCGSSREHAVWALADFGIQAVLALSFGDIFRNNCVNNGIVAATLAEAEHRALVAALAAQAEPAALIDIATQQVRLPGGAVFAMALAPGHAQKLISGEDDITRTLRLGDALTAYEARVAQAQPWLARAAPISQIAVKNG